MKTSKKMLSLLLIAAMLVSVLCMGVSASDYAEVSISEGEPVMATSMGNNVFYIPAETFEGAFTSGVVVTATASSSTAKVFINGESTGTFTIQDASRGVQILVQDGNSAPFILVIK